VNILIVEDSLCLIRLYENIIQTLTNHNHNIKIISITNCDIYNDFYKNYKFELALVVWQLQDCNTLSIIKDIINKTKLYVISNKDDVDNVEKVINEYGAPVKVKPITVDDIRDMLKEVSLIE